MVYWSDCNAHMIINIEYAQYRWSILFLFLAISPHSLPQSMLVLEIIRQAHGDSSFESGEIGKGKCRYHRIILQKPWSQTFWQVSIPGD